MVHATLHVMATLIARIGWLGFLVYLILGHNGCAQQEGLYYRGNLTDAEVELAQSALDELCAVTEGERCGLVVDDDSDAANLIQVVVTLPNKADGQTDYPGVLPGALGKHTVVHITDKRGATDWPDADDTRTCRHSYGGWFRSVVLHEMIHAFRNHSGHLTGANLMAPDSGGQCHPTPADVAFAQE